MLIVKMTPGGSKTNIQLLSLENMVLSMISKIAILALAFTASAPMTCLARAGFSIHLYSDGKCAAHTSLSYNSLMTDVNTLDGLSCIGRCLDLSKFKKRWQSFAIKDQDKGTSCVLYKTPDCTITSEDETSSVFFNGCHSLAAYRKGPGSIVCESVHECDYY